jgi:hypothetical protein
LQNSSLLLLVLTLLLLLLLLLLSSLQTSMLVKVSPQSTLCLLSQPACYVQQTAQLIPMERLHTPTA